MYDSKKQRKRKTGVVQVIRYAYPHIGGMEQVVSQINDALPSDEYEKEVLCCSNETPSSVENGVKYTRCKFLFEFASNTISPEFLWRLSKVDTDILHYHMPFIFAVICHFIARPKYKKLYISYISDIVGYDKYMKPFWGIYKRFISLADKIHIMFPWFKDDSFMLEEVKDKCVCIPHGISLAPVHVDESRVQQIKGKYSGKKILFSLGRHVKYKGFKYAIEAMKYVDNAVYLLGGSGPLTSEFEEYIENNNLKDKVILLGRLSDEELNLYYQACDIYLFPSCMPSEVFGIVQLEAMKYSKPIINTDLGTGVNYVSIDGETGITVEKENPKAIADAINKLLNDNNLRLQYGQNARKRVEQVFDEEKVKEQFREFYEKI